MKKLMSGVSPIAILSLFATGAYAQVEELIVTATKRSESTQDVAVAVQAIGEQAIDDLNIDTFTDYLQQLPGVSAGGSGPGQGTIYIRGLASTTPTITVAAATGIAPNVALYLDEQPVTQVGRNLDVYAVDLSRVEVLPGPQGTLFGSSSQAGTVRLITNKPNLDGFSASSSAGVSFTEGGEMSNKVELVANFPVTDRLALRAVVYNDFQGGYIDNVRGTRDASVSARFTREAGDVRANGTVVEASQTGFQVGSDFSDVTFIPTDNFDLAEENFNDTTYTGFRIGALFEINDDWTFHASHARQRIDSEGVFFTDPELGDPDELSIERFAPDTLDDRYESTAWTLEGRLGALEALYTGAYLDRKTLQTVDYSDYLFVGQYLPYYLCDASVTYPAGAPTGTCYAPDSLADSRTNAQTMTHELRFNTPSDLRARATAGVFYSDQKVEELNDFYYTSDYALIQGFAPDAFGFPRNFPLDGALTTRDGAAPEGVIFFNDITRTDNQIAVFGEGSIDLIPETLTITGGLRWYDIDVDLEGSANSSFFNLGSDTDAQAFGANLSTLYDGTQTAIIGGQTVNLPDKANASGVIFKGNLSWTPTDDLLFYFTYSEGFRPPLLNRPVGAGGIVPGVVDTDDVVNFEVGWKTNLFGNTVQLNGNAFFMKIDRLQTTVFDPNIVNLVFSDNAANAEIKGVEGDVIWAPAAVEGLTITSAFSVLDTEITEILTATTAIVEEGSELAFSPSFQGNVRARYEWPLSGDLDAYVMPQITYSGSSFSDIVAINRAKQDAYTLVDFAAGIRKDNWSLDFFGSNLTDERAQLNNNFFYDRERITVNRPRTYGMRVTVNFE